MKREESERPCRHLDFATVRWMDKHHNKRVTNRVAVDPGKVKQLREMFDHIDMDGSNDIQVSEVEQALRHLTALNPRCPLEKSKVMETFRYTDSDGSGTIDWPEFVAVMTSDTHSEAYPLLSDEMSAKDNQQQVFYEFATLYRRQMLINDIKANTSANRVCEAYNIFRELFDVQLAADKLAESAQVRLRSQVRKQLRAQARLLAKRSNAASRALIKKRRTVELPRWTTSRTSSASKTHTALDDRQLTSVALSTKIPSPPHRNSRRRSCRPRISPAVASTINSIWAHTLADKHV